MFAFLFSCWWTRGNIWCGGFLDIFPQLSDRFSLFHCKLNTHTCNFIEPIRIHVASTKSPYLRMAGCTSQSRNCGIHSVFYNVMQSYIAMWDSHLLLPPPNLNDQYLWILFEGHFCSVKMSCEMWYAPSLAFCRIFCHSFFTSTWFVTFLEPRYWKHFMASDVETFSAQTTLSCNVKIAPFSEIIVTKLKQLVRSYVYLTCRYK